MMWGPLVYTLCALTALACAFLLLRARARGGSPLLLWSGLCFACLSLNNALVVVDLVIFPEVNLFLIRNVAALLGMLLLIYGLIWESE
jgi:hypothetical protein